jgi:predicted Zn-dependent protease with MMP-like domain
MDDVPPNQQLHEAGRLLAEGDAPAAAARLSHLLAAGPLPPTWEAEARYLLGRALGASGDHDGMAREWLAVARLDAVTALPPRMSVEEFEAAAELALDELPQQLIDELQGTAIIVLDRPSPDMVASGIDPRILGLYHGVPMLKRSAMFGAPYADTIHLFRANLERVCPTREALAARIRIVVLHETAHFFGYTERQLREMGLA